MKHRVEHLTESYSNETVVTDNTLNVVKDLAILEGLDNTPTVKELSSGCRLFTEWESTWE